LTISDVDGCSVIFQGIPEGADGSYSSLPYELGLMTQAGSSTGTPIPTPEPTETPVPTETPPPTQEPTPDPTDVPVDCSNAPEWNADAVYENTGMRVVYNGNLYENNWYSSGQNPEENSGEYEVWTLIGPCDPDAPTAEPTETPDPTSPPGNIGDVNEDGTIDIVDALLIAQYYVGLSPDPFNYDNADTNCDSNVNIVDALLVAQYYVGLISSFC
jgi:hypothetical protein